jgi:hypothetical protein
MPRLVRLLVALLIAAAAAAAEPPRFPLERITIEGLRWASPRILVAESRLTPGRDYSESELRDAAARIRRLPFVLRSDFRLEKGSQRGRYVLVIAVTETKPYFLGYDSVHQSASGGARATVDKPTLGARWFLGARGVAAASYERGDLNRFGLGFTQYDLFGTRASIAATLQYGERSVHPLPEWSGPQGARFADHLTYEVTVAMPLFANQALRASWLRRTDFTAATIGDDERVHFLRSPTDAPELAWVYDTTDDALLPARGTFVKAAWQPTHFTLLTPLPHTFLASASRTWQSDYALTAARHWELSPLHSVAARGELLTRSDAALREVRVVAEWDARLLTTTSAHITDLRLEAAAERAFSRGLGDDFSEGTLRAGVVFRNEWALVHLGFSYTGWRHQPR